jgi:membrane associated rhomboid family serine protease
MPDDSLPAAGAAPRRCFRHPDRETGVVCPSCERAMCPECVVPLDIGPYCVECVLEGSRRTAELREGPAPKPIVTYALIAVCVIVYFGPGGGSLRGGLQGRLAGDLVLFGPAVANGEWYRVVSSMFLHASVLHLAFNMWALYAFGPILEARLGSVRFALFYAIGGLWSAAVVLVLSPDAYTVGASGAIFGLMAALLVAERQVTGSWQLGGVGTVIAINLVFTFAVPGISVGGHIGGLIGGFVAALAFERTGIGRGPITSVQVAIALVLLAGAAGVCAYAAR